jgi:hypothetical protein
MSNPADIKWGNEDKSSPLSVFILYDRSGSMRPKQDEAVPAMNAYVEALSPDTVVTIIAFDNQDPHLVIRDHVRVRDYRPVEIGVVEARGMTPLYDATGWIIDQIFKDAPFRAVLVVQTDGEENNSREYNWSAITKKMEDMKAKNYPVVFLGSEFKDVGKVSGSLGVGIGQTVNMTRGNYYGASASMASKTAAYACSGIAPSWSADEKAALGDTDTVDPKEKKGKKAGPMIGPGPKSA